MFFKVIFACVLAAFLREVSAHGRLMDPVSRSTAWRVGYKTPENFNDNELYCGGFGTQYNQNEGKCGPCGDNYADPQPRPNENGGLYGTGTIVRIYKSGQKIELKVDLTANHMGYFDFSLCPLKQSSSIETELCFNDYPIYLANGTRHYQLTKSEQGPIQISAYLPKTLKCQHCVLRWNYRCGNNAGTCEDGSNKMGCGPQETFRGCADISIH